MGCKKILKKFYDVWSFNVLPFMGKIIAKNADAYKYYNQEPDILYRSMTHNFKLGEFFSFPQNVKGIKTINFSQCTTTPLPNHPVSKQCYFTICV